MWTRFNGVAGNIRSNISQFASEVQQQLRDESDSESPTAAAVTPLHCSS